MKIITVTTNPALDVNLQLPYLQWGEANAVETMFENPGGKGVNVARVYSQLKQTKNIPEQVLVSGFLGGANGKKLAALLRESYPQLIQFWTSVTAETRRAIIVREGKTTTVINEPGPILSLEYWKLLSKQVLEIVDSGDVLAFCGSTPPGIDSTLVGALLEALTFIGVKVVVDARGENLLEAIKVKPWIVKPNEHEIVQTFGPLAPVAGVKKILDLGARAAVVSLGDKGMICGTKNWQSEDETEQEPLIWKLTPGKSLVGNPTGAGDAAVAVFCNMLFNCRDITDLAVQLPSYAKWAVAVSGATVLSETIDKIDFSTVENIADKVQVEILSVA